MTKSDKIQAIEKEVARKDLTFGCEIIRNNNKNIVLGNTAGCGYDLYESFRIPQLIDGVILDDEACNVDRIEEYEILGHPVTLEDILIRADKNKKPYFYECGEIVICPKNTYIYIPRLLGKPLSEQADETINALSDLILKVKGDAR